MAENTENSDHDCEWFYPAGPICKFCHQRPDGKPCPVKVHPGRGQSDG